MVAELKSDFSSRVAAFVLRHRILLTTILLLATCFLGYQASKIQVDAGFEKQLPKKHQYIQTFLKHRKEFGSANRLLVLVESPTEDIFTPEYFEVMKAVTDQVRYLKGVNRGGVRSIFTPNVRFVEIVEGGFSGGNVVPAEFQPTPEMLSVVRENIIKANIVGRLVANDFKSAMVSAELVDQDPQTGEQLDYLEVASELEAKVRAKYEKNGFRIRIIGFAKAMGDIADGASGVITFFGIAFVVTLILVLWFTGSWVLTLLSLGCSLAAVAWGLGMLSLLGFGIDPMSILVPFLVFAIAISHSVQIVHAFKEGISDKGPEGALSARDAAERSLGKLWIPGTVALLSDAAGFLTIMLLEIRIIQELALTAALGVSMIFFSNLLLLTLCLSFVNENRISKKESSVIKLSKCFGVFATGKAAYICIPFALIFGVLGSFEALQVKVGDLGSGVPELRQTERYNIDSRYITEHYSIGVELLSVLVETNPDACTNPDILRRIDHFAWQVQNTEGVQSTISLPQIIKIVNAGWNEGHPAWRIIPRNPQTIVQSLFLIQTDTGLLNADCSVMPVLVFLKDRRAETIKRVVDVVKEYATQHNSNDIKFQLASGNMGIAAARNEVVSAAQTEMLLLVYVAVSILVLLAFRSIRAVICVILPLSLVSILCYALMTWLEIGLTLSTLPVAALGVGIGVDYGIYILNGLRIANRRGRSFEKCYESALARSGAAVLLTGLTLAVGVSTWYFSKLQFQADMGILLAFMFIANMIGALVFIPILARLTGLYVPQPKLTGDQEV